MTGEMSHIDAQGNDSNGESWPLHAAVAKALRCELRPFDVYIGPYIAHPRGKLFIGSEDGCLAYVCLWPGGIAPAFRDPIVSPPFLHNDEQAAIIAARRVLAKAKGE